MKILLLAAPNSSHTIKWANSLSESGIEVGVFGLAPYDRGEYNDSIKFETIDYENISTKYKEGAFMKINYLKTLPRLMRFIKSFNPDLLHAHYASSYGLLGALSRKHPFFLSVWGSDILEYPLKSIFRRWLISFNLKKADVIFATSQYLASAAQNYTKKSIIVTPFGVKLNKFNKTGTGNDYEKSKKPIIIGTVKSLEPVYGIDILIKAFKIVKERNHEINLKLLIAGDGSERQNLEKLVSDMSIEGHVEFIGYVKPSNVVNCYNRIDIFANLSRRESFGVSVVEAMACGLPVIASSVGGLKEILADGDSGILIEPDNVFQTAEAIEYLVLNSDKRNQIGKCGKLQVEKYYDWDKNIIEIISMYKNYLNREIQ